MINVDFIRNLDAIVVFRQKYRNKGYEAMANERLISVTVFD